MVVCQRSSLNVVGEGVVRPLVWGKKGDAASAEGGGGMFRRFEKKPSEKKTSVSSPPGRLRMPKRKKKISRRPAKGRSRHKQVAPSPQNFAAKPTSRGRQSDKARTRRRKEGHAKRLLHGSLN